MEVEDQPPSGCAAPGSPPASLGLRFLAVQWRCSRPSASWDYCVRGRTVREGPLGLFKGEPQGRFGLGGLSQSPPGWSQGPKSLPHFEP